MVLKLFGLAISTTTKQVAMISKAKQPFGQIPYLDDDGFILYEGRAICRYLEDKFPNQGTKLIPSDIRQRALFEQGASIETSNFDSLAAPIAYEAVFKPPFGQTPNQAKIDELKTSLAARLDVYEVILSKQKYIAGDNITLAGLFHLPYGVLLAKAGVNLIQERPHVAKWFDDLQSRPSWQAVKDGVASRA